MYAILLSVLITEKWVRRQTFSEKVHFRVMSQNQVMKFVYLGKVHVEICLKIEVNFLPIPPYYKWRWIFSQGRAKVVLFLQKVIKPDILHMKIGVETYLKFEGDF